MDDKEMITQCYHTMYQGMIKKDMQLLDESLDDTFVLVHMTGMKQNKKQYMDAIADGTLNYYSEDTEHTDVTIRGDTAQFVGQSRVNAAVFGGGRNSWRLQLSIKAEKRNGKWHITEAVASTY